MKASLILFIAIVVSLNSYPVLSQDSSNSEARAFSNSQVVINREWVKQQICDNRKEIITRILSTVNYVADLHPDQVLLLGELRSKIDEVDPVIQQACDEVESLGDGFLASMERRRLAVSTLLQVMNKVQPGIKALYMSLSDDQLSRLREVAPPLIADKL